MDPAHVVVGLMLNCEVPLSAICFNQSLGNPSNKYHTPSK